MTGPTSVSDIRAAKRQSKLFHLSVIEFKDEQDEKMESCFNALQQKIKDLSEKETHDAIVALVSVSPAANEDVSLGLLFGILTNPQLANKFYRDLTLISKDSFVLIMSKVNWIIMEMFNKLYETPKLQLIWFIREAIKNNVSYMDNVCINLMRVAAGVNINQNLWLADTLLSIFNENRQYVDKSPVIIAYAVYFYLRSINDHVSPQHENLRNKEIKFCITYLRERFMDCLNIISRELGRALIMVGRIPEFEKLWYDILHNPTSLSPQFTSIWQLLSYQVPKRTPSKILLCRLTVEIERKIHFFLNNVRLTNQKYYLEWLQRPYLSTPESQTIRSDIVRYVCCMIHPTNEVLASDIVPRWSFIMWLLNTCSNLVELQLMRMALFYDWLFFDPTKESIMNIEPAILLLFNSLKTNPLFASSLMDYLCRIVANICPSVTAQVKSCAITSFKQILEKKVVPSLAPLFVSPKFDPDLQYLIRDIFDELCLVKEEKEDSPHSSSAGPAGQHHSSSTSQLSLGASTSFSGSAPIKLENLNLDEIPLSIETHGGLEPEDLGDQDQPDQGEYQDEGFSDDESELPTITSDNLMIMESEVPERKERRTSQLAIWESNGDLINPLDDPAPANILDGLQLLDPSLRPLVEDLQKISEDNYVRGDRVYKILMQILQMDEFDEEQASALAGCLCGLFKPFFARRVFPDTYESEADLEETLQAPIFVIFRNLCFTPDEEVASRRPQLLVTSEMYLKQPRIGYLLLYFLIYNNSGGDKMSAYRDLCKMIDEELETMLIKDLKLCQEDDYRLFIYIAPHIYKKFTSIAVQSTELMHLVVSTVDAVQMQDLICEIVQGNLQLFRKDTFPQLISASLKWETIEQYFFWQLINADDVPLEWVYPSISKLIFPDHAEAMANVLLMLKRTDKEPTMVLARHLLSREPYKKSDFFTVSAMKILIDDYEDKMADLISNLLSKSPPEPSNVSKIKKIPAKTLTLDSILGHLDMFRQYNKQGQNFFAKDIVQQTLQDVKKSAPESLKTKYSELFGMMEILDSVRDGRSLRRGRKITPAQHDSSDEERVSKSPAKHSGGPKKKRKVVESDSD